MKRFNLRGMTTIEITHQIYQRLNKDDISRIERIQDLQWKALKILDKDFDEKYGEVV